MSTSTAIAAYFTFGAVTTFWYFMAMIVMLSLALFMVRTPKKIIDGKF